MKKFKKSKWKNQWINNCSLIFLKRNWLEILKKKTSNFPVFNLITKQGFGRKVFRFYIFSAYKRWNILLPLESNSPFFASWTRGGKKGEIENPYAPKPCCQDSFQTKIWLLKWVNQEWLLSEEFIFHHLRYFQEVVNSTRYITKHRCDGFLIRS